MDGVSTKVFPAQLAELPALFRWLTEKIKALGGSPSVIRKIELAVEEWVVNLILHAGVSTFTLEFRGTREQWIEISLLDAGRAFHPFEQTSQVDLTSPLPERREGGVGLFLMKKMVDEVSYGTRGKQNCLMLKKRL